MKILSNHKTILYRLKRQFGLQIYLYRAIENTNDVTTGKIIRRYQIIPIRRAPVLPSREFRRFHYDLNYIQAGNNFTMGAYLDIDSKAVILDRRDLPKNFKPNLDDFIIFDYQRYDIKEIADYQELASYAINITTVENQEKEKWISLKNIINFEQTVI